MKLKVVKVEMKKEKQQIIILMLQIKKQVKDSVVGFIKEEMKELQRMQLLKYKNIFVLGDRHEEVEVNNTYTIIKK